MPLAREQRSVDMTTEQNKVTVRRFCEEVWDKGNVDFAFEVFAGHSD
jgi:hypothetical protein